VAGINNAVLTPFPDPVIPGAKPFEPFELRMDEEFTVPAFTPQPLGSIAKPDGVGLFNLINFSQCDTTQKPKPARQD
jgi:hypothetical protein